MDSKLLTRDGKILWERLPPPKNSANIYRFSQLACQLNEEEVGVAPTDSRHRLDVHLMERIELEKTAEEKLRLKSRMYKKTQPVNENNVPPHKPVCFDLSEKGSHSISNGKYWNCKRDKDWTLYRSDFYN